MKINHLMWDIMKDGDGAGTVDSIKKLLIYTAIVVVRNIEPDLVIGNVEKRY